MMANPDYGHYPSFAWDFPHGSWVCQDDECRGSGVDDYGYYWNFGDLVRNFKTN